jgi:hypothetical protein
MFSFPGCNLSPRCINFGPNQARAPATKATHVKPAVESINDLFLQTSLTSSMYDVVCMWDEPSLCPRSGSSMKYKRPTAMAASTGVTLRAQCHDPRALAVSDPTMYLRRMRKTKINIAADEKRRTQNSVLYRLKASKRPDYVSEQHHVLVRYD